MDPLLPGDDPLSGAVGVQRWLTTARNVHLVDPLSFPDVVAAVEATCNLWSGAYHPLVPVPDGATTIPQPWRTLVVDTDQTRRGRPCEDGSPFLRFGEQPSVSGRRAESIAGDMPLAVLDRMRKPAEGYRTVRTANALDPADHGRWRTRRAGFTADVTPVRRELCQRVSAGQRACGPLEAGGTRLAIARRWLEPRPCARCCPGVWTGAG
jgi:hypothetical protein